jgi:hypothetical protein
MTTQIRTLWLFSAMGLLAPLTGCVESHHGPRYGGGGGGPQACLDQQYFEVAWGVDNGPGTLPLSCAQIGAMASHVEIITTAPAPDDRLSVDFFLTCQDGRVCPDGSGSPCPMDGTTFSGLPAGTSIVEGDLIGNDGRVLSYATIDPATYSQYAIPSCDFAIAPFVFGLLP